jgi:hypothetical protein
MNAKNRVSLENHPALKLSAASAPNYLNLAAGASAAGHLGAGAGPQHGLLQV